MELILMLIPLFVIVGVLVMKKHMLVAGIFGGLTAVVVSFILRGMGTIDEAITFVVMQGLLTDGVEQMLSTYIAPVIYASAAVMISKTGAFKALVELLNRLLQGKIAWIAAAIVIVQAIATYMSGLGAGNTMVIAPLLAAAVGFIPQVVGAMAIATAVAFTTSPASTETALTSDTAGMVTSEFANMMLPFSATVFILAAALAFYGVKKKGDMIQTSDAEKSEFADATDKDLWFRIIPILTFLFVVVVGGALNDLFPSPVFIPFINVIIVAILCVIFGKTSMDETSKNFVDGSKFILTTLFGVGVFLGFINFIAHLGTFEELAGWAGEAPGGLVVLTAILIGFFIAIPAGAFAAGVLTLIFPTLGLLELTPFAYGLVAIGVGLGTQISPVQINVAALSEGFNLTIIDVVRNNVRFVAVAITVLSVIGLITGVFF